MTVGTNNLTLFDLIFNSFKTYCRVCIPCKIVLLFAIDVVEVHLAVMIALSTVSAG